MAAERTHAFDLIGVDVAESGRDVGIQKKQAEQGFSKSGRSSCQAPMGIMIDSHSTRLKGTIRGRGRPTLLPGRRGRRCVGPSACRRRRLRPGARRRSGRHPHATSDRRGTPASRSCRRRAPDRPLPQQQQHERSHSSVKTMRTKPLTVDAALQSSTTATPSSWPARSTSALAASSPAMPSLS